MSTAAIIVAAGRGTRAGGATPKQWREIAGQSVLLHTLQAFHEHSEIDCVVLVLHVDDLDRAPAVDGLFVTSGGSERSASVKAGLQAVPSSIRNVLIHDVARPCISPSTISDIIAVLDTSVGAAPALPVTDALWTGSDGHVTGTKDRRDIYRAQTPQGFHLDAIIAAHAAYVGNAADDVEVARAAGIEVAIVAGDEDNLKITLPGDFERAQRILERRNGH
jgi:2-C-methyl-D-erythritol 4-phosphate cytidylyltransferase